MTLHYITRTPHESGMAIPFGGKIRENEHRFGLDVVPTTGGAVPPAIASLFVFASNHPQLCLFEIV